MLVKEVIKIKVTILKNAELLLKGQKLIYSRFVDGILDHDNIHRFGREETFSDSYNDETMDTSDYNLPNLESEENQEKILQKRHLKGLFKKAGSTGDLTGNKIADKITSAGKTNKNSKELQQSESEEVYMPIEKSQLIIDDLKLI